MKIVALLAVRNEERYLRRCLEHLYEQGIETCVIDNESTDRTLEIAESFVNRGVIRIEHLPFTGVFELKSQLLCKERLAGEIAADWFIHCDADEIREAPKPYRTLREGIEAVDRRGYNAIDFDEFVFLPTSDDESFDGRDYVEAMRYYYYFEPDSPDRYRINAWKHHPKLDLHTLAGHKALFPGMRVSPDSFILRHYLVLSRAHAIEKYGRRNFSPSEMAISWHGDRASFRSDDFEFPAKERLKNLDQAGEFDKSEPWKSHPLFFSKAGATVFSSRTPSTTELFETDRSGSERTAGIAILKKFKQEQSDCIPDIDPISDSADRPFWSVMIPTYNASESYLVQALESILVQDPGAASMQIEVVDDGTTTFDPESVVKEIGKGRVAFYRQPRTLGLAGNWNACLRRARGLWVHLLHQDDKVLGGFYERLRAPCTQDPRIAAAFCRGAGIDETGKIKWVQEPERETAGILVNFVAREAATNRIVSPSIIIRRAVYEEIGGFHTGMPYCADWDLYKRVALFGPIWYEPQCLACWREHDASASALLKTSGEDLVDRRRSVELSKAYLPANIENSLSNSALKSSLIWAAEILRESLVHDKFATALAQTREIARTLEQLSNDHSGAEEQTSFTLNHSSEVSAGLQAKVDSLEAQLQAWIRTAEAIQAKYRHSH